MNKKIIIGAIILILAAGGFIIWQKTPNLGGTTTISNLTALSEAPASNDVLMIVDTSLVTTKKITFDYLFNYPFDTRLSATTTLGNLTAIGTITVGVWNGTLIDPIYGGTGLGVGGLKSTFIPFGNGISAFATSSAFYFTTTTSLLTVTNASSTLFSASYASSTAGYFGSLTALGTFIAPSSTSQTPASAGQIGIDTTSDQFKYFGTALRTLMPFYTTSFNLSSSTWGTGTTTVFVGPAPSAIMVTNAFCETSAGTLDMSLYDGTNRANMIVASTTIGNFTFSTYNTFTAGESMRVDVGTAASSPTWIGCTLKYTYTSD